MAVAVFEWVRSNKDGLDQETLKSGYVIELLDMGKDFVIILLIS
jgi:hypothetical protein